MKTADEFLEDYLSTNNLPWSLEMEKQIGCVYNAMIEFAKMHVQEALKQALESIPCLGSSTDIANYEEVEEAVLNSYPLDLIK